MGGSKAQRQRRARRVLELSLLGMTIPDISAALKNEGFRATSERTVWNDLHSIDAQQYQEELLRKQLTDITIADIGLRLKYRDRLLDKLMPHKIETKQDVSVDTKDYTIVLADVGADTWEDVLKKRAQEKEATDEQDDTDTPG